MVDLQTQPGGRLIICGLTELNGLLDASAGFSALSVGEISGSGLALMILEVGEIGLSSFLTVLQFWGLQLGAALGPLGRPDGLVDVGGGAWAGTWIPLEVVMSVISGLVTKGVGDAGVGRLTGWIGKGGCVFKGDCVGGLVTGTGVDGRLSTLAGGAHGALNAYDERLSLGCTGV